MIMYGVSGSVSGRGTEAASPTLDSASPHATSRSAVHGISTASPNRRTTTTRRTVGASATAASAVSLSRTIEPRRRNPSAVISSDASQSRSRLATAAAP